MDWQVLLDKFFGDQAFVAQIVRTFLDQLPQLLEKLEEGYRSADAEAIAEAAHTIKGAVGNFQVGPPSKQPRHWNPPPGEAHPSKNSNR